jgi:hypothetical protein
MGLRSGRSGHPNRVRHPVCEKRDILTVLVAPHMRRHRTEVGGRLPFNCRRD